jgi:hypothetical protein
MGHIRLGELARSMRWRQVIELLKAGSGVEDLAAATADAAETELENAKGDPAFAYTVWLLTQLPLAARAQRFSERLIELGFDPDAERSILTLVAGVSTAVDRNVSGHPGRSDLGELARQAATETLSSILSASTPSLFGTSAEDVQRELARLATKDRFAGLARDFFARLTQKTLEYYISRELPNHVGPGKSIVSYEQQIAFRAALAQHCNEASAIVETFAGVWYSKSNYYGTLNPDTAQAFADYALTKMRDELRARRSADG